MKVDGLDGLSEDDIVKDEEGDVWDEKATDSVTEA